MYLAKITLQGLPFTTLNSFICSIHLLPFFDLAVYDVLRPTARQNPSGRTPGFILSRVVMLPERRCISPNEYKVTANIRRYLRNGNVEMIFVFYLEWV